MNIKYYAIVGILLLGVILFSPIVPNDGTDVCGYAEECDELTGYISLFDKYFK
jgi:hypothetical protein